MKALKYIKNISFASAIAAAFLTLTSCGMINDDLPECKRGVELRFIYDYNMEFANAFYSQVDCLTLLVYDAQGNYVTSRAETSDALKDENYRMTLDLAPGTYTFVAYGGMECDKSSFHFVKTPSADVNLTDNQVELNADCLTSPLGTELHPLFYGKLEMEVPDEWREYTKGTVAMMRDTNNLRIVMEQNDGEPLSNEYFDFKLIDDNKLMAWDNAVIPTSLTTYNPWALGDFDLGKNHNGETVNACYAEFSFPRIIYPAQTKVDEKYQGPHLLVTRKGSSDPVIDIDIIPYLLAMKSEHYKAMGAQEFLDREHEWSLIFILDRHLNWYQIQIRVQDWVVRINRTDLGV
ncbi:MAG: FimB/Mfa2 family fimbrial subunit [Muribaculum sp.]|nr:FimB/Mfa2 family fimbrial subunit [Muribaculum sp.]